MNVSIDGLVRERRNSSALAIELRFSCTNPSSCRTDDRFYDIHFYSNFNACNTPPFLQPFSKKPSNM